MLAVKVSKNQYKFIDTDKLKAKVFNLATAALAVYGLIAVVTN